MLDLPEVYAIIYRHIQSRDLEWTEKSPGKNEASLNMVVRKTYKKTTLISVGLVRFHSHQHTEKLAESAQYALMFRRKQENGRKI